jgi:hypothetical protein
MVSQRAGTVAAVAQRMRYPRWHGNESPGRDRDRLGLAPDLEGQLALEDVEGVGVLVVNVRTCYLFTRCIARLRDGDFLARDEDADLAPLAPKDRLPAVARLGNSAGVEVASRSLASALIVGPLRLEAARFGPRWLIPNLWP